MLRFDETWQVDSAWEEKVALDLDPDPGFCFFVFCFFKGYFNILRQEKSPVLFPSVVLTMVNKRLEGLHASHS